jgi:hypothetical protein
MRGTELNRSTIDKRVTKPDNAADIPIQDKPETCSGVCKMDLSRDVSIFVENN